MELRDDVALFEAVKGRMLNAAHMTLSYPALMCGFRLVDEAMREPAARAFLDAFLTRDVIPLVEGRSTTGMVRRLSEFTIFPHAPEPFPPGPIHARREPAATRQAGRPTTP